MFLPMLGGRHQTADMASSAHAMGALRLRCKILLRRFCSARQHRGFRLVNNKHIRIGVATCIVVIRTGGVIV